MDGWKRLAGMYVCMYVRRMDEFTYLVTLHSIDFLPSYSGRGLHILRVTTRYPDEDVSQTHRFNASGDGGRWLRRHGVCIWTRTRCERRGWLLVYYV